MVFELNSRTNSGLTVELLFNEDRREVWLHVEDEKNPEGEFLRRVPNDEASFAFEHPFLYQPTKTKTNQE